MADVIRADEHGVLHVPPEQSGQVPPGTRFTIEQSGDTLILRRQPHIAEDARGTSSPAQPIAWLEDWIANLPPSPALPRQATHRDSMYD
jgi:hypothetical protein